MGTNSDDLRLKVVIVSPDDVKKEREIICSAVEKKVNAILRDTSSPYRMEATDQGEVPPGPGLANEVAGKYLRVEECDIFIAIVWYRFGTPPGTNRPGDNKPYQSGTEQEVDKAFIANRKNGGHKPRIMIYRKTDPLPENLTDDDHKQYGKLLDFLDEFKSTGRHPAYVFPVSTERLEETIVEHLLKACYEIEAEKVSPQKSISYLGFSPPGLEWMHRVGLKENPFFETPPEGEEYLVPFWELDLSKIRTLLEHAEPGYVFGPWASGKTTLLKQIVSLANSGLTPYKIYCAQIQASHFDQILDRLSSGLHDFRISHFVQGLYDSVVNNLTLQNRDVRSSPNLHLPAPPTSMLEALMGWIKQVGGYTHLLCLVDQMDEISLVKSNPNPDSVILRLLEEMAIIPKKDGLMMRYFLPISMEEQLYPQARLFRLDKSIRIHLNWNEAKLLELIERRMSAASGGRYHSIGELFDDSQSIIPVDVEMARLAGSNLRALLWLGRRLIERHIAFKDPTPIINSHTWEQVKEEWQTERRVYFPLSVQKDFEIKGATPYFHGTEIRLSPTLERLLCCLIEAQGEVCDRLRLIKAGWPDVDDPQLVNEKMFYEQMRNLKKTLDHIAPGWLINVRSKGYQLRNPDNGGQE